MALYKDSVINNILTKENARLLKEATLIADRKSLEEFGKKMDDIYINYFKNIHSFKEEVFDVSCTFPCNGNGKIKIDPVKSLSFKTGSQENWFKDSFMLNIKPIIEAGVYTTLLETYTNPTLKTDFLNWFEQSFASYSNLGLADRDSFSVTVNAINNELEPYMTRSINMPTIYSYSFKYVSSVKQPTWKYIKEGNGSEKFNDKSEGENKVEITENLKQLFREKFGHLNKGKYTLKISTLSLNGQVNTSQDIQLVE